MTAQVLFFGATADIAGTKNIEIDVQGETTVSTILKYLLKRFPGMSLYNLKIAINEEYAVGDEIVRDGDNLAVFTAVSGG